MKRPSMFIAVLFTFSAMCGLLTFVLELVNKRYSGGLVIFQGFTFVLLTISAVGNWYIYFRQYVKYEISLQLETPGEQE